MSRAVFRSDKNEVFDNKNNESPPNFFRVLSVIQNHIFKLRFLGLNLKQVFWSMIKNKEIQSLGVRLRVGKDEYPTVPVRKQYQI